MFWRKCEILEMGNKTETIPTKFVLFEGSVDHAVAEKYINGILNPITITFIKCNTVGVEVDRF